MLHRDVRGGFMEYHNNKNFKASTGQEIQFCQDNITYSKKGVLRGLHIQTKLPQAKIITVTNGKIMDVAVDLRKNSKTFGKYFSIVLSEKENKSLLIPAGFAHGFYTLADNTILHYKCSKYRHAKSEIGILWNDRDLKIKWPIKKLIISKKNKKK